MLDLAPDTGEMTRTAFLAGDPEAIGRMYRTVARRLHPDMGGDPEQFKRLTEAHEIIKKEGAA
jgi:curved DNA-binding protein CbpA